MSNANEDDILDANARIVKIVHSQASYNSTVQELDDLAKVLTNCARVVESVEQARNLRNRT
jgi:hypothetical protein